MFNTTAFTNLKTFTLFVILGASMLWLSPVTHAATELTFNGSPTITEGNGRDTGSVGTTARWSNVGVVNGVALDLEIEVIANNRSGDSLRFVTERNDACVYLESAEEGSGNQVTDLAYHFYEAGTSNPVTIIPRALISDIDGDPTATVETVKVAANQVASYSLEGPTADDTDLTVTLLNNGTQNTADDRLKVTSSRRGGPSDSNIAVQFDFQPTSTITMTFKATIDGRRFTFDGDAESFFNHPNDTKLDTAAPITPTVNQLSTRDTTPTLMGTAESFTTVTIVVAGATYEVIAAVNDTWSLDTGTATPINGTFNPNTDGTPNEVVVTSTDAAGNSSQDTTNDELVIDTVPPIVATISAPAANLANETTYAVSGTCSEGDGNVSVNIAGAQSPTQTVACRSGEWRAIFDVSGIADGVDAIGVNASQTDAVGNTGDAALVEADKDTSAPAVVITDAPIATQANQTTYVVGGTCSIGDGDVTITIAGIPMQTVACNNGNWTATFDVSGLTDGINAIDINASQTDVAGNNGSAAAVQAGKDSTGPLVAITSAPNATMANQNAYPVSGTCSAGESNVSVAIVGITPAQSVACSNSGTWSATFDVSDLNDGIDAITVNASQTDNVGNLTNATPVSADKDSSAPTLAITDNGSGDGRYNAIEAAEVIITGITNVADGQVVSVTFTDQQSKQVTATASVTGGNWVTAAINLAGLESGVLTIVATVSDSAGNSAEAATDRVQLDTNTPLLTVNISGITNAIPTFSGTTDQPEGAIVSVKDSSGELICQATVVAATPSNTWTCTAAKPFDEGRFNLVASTQDEAGNITNVDFNLEIGLDDDRDGIPNFVEGDSDPDGDGIANSRDTDSDNDGIPDIIEGTIDTDADTTPNYIDVDSDNDGIPDHMEEVNIPTLSGNDGDLDGIDDVIDVNVTGGNDTNLNGIDDALEPTDSDGDGNPDYIDGDSDNDGIPDAVEAANLLDLSGTDSDIDGIDDVLDVDVTGGVDANGNGVDDALEAIDTDGDATPDYLDIDADGDGIIDAVEADASGNDSDSDTIDDIFDVDNTGGVDADGDGVDDAMTATDTDADGTPDYLDLDSDNDGVSDVLEADLIDSDQNGQSDGGVTTSTPPDSDGDNIADYRDIDSDNDGLPDNLEIGGDGANAIDTDGDGTPDYLDTDSDNDGIADADESMAVPFVGIDSDSDGIDDAIDVDVTGGADVNGNGIDDALEPGDSDGDGTSDYRDRDSDNDGIPDILEGNEDPDGDGLPNAVDLDSDNDGISDAMESLNIPELSGQDSDHDGIDDSFDLDLTGDDDLNGNGIDDDLEPVDTDKNGIPNFIDPDSDRDGIPDSVEANNVPLLTGLDSDNDGFDDAVDVDQTGGADANGNGLDDALEPIDSDGDGMPNYTDIDSDNDGIIDLVEGGAVNFDIDNDGIDDLFDVDSTGGADLDNDGVDDAVLPRNSDNDSALDYVDLDSDNDTLSDVIEADLEDLDQDGFSDGNVKTDSPPDTDGDGAPDYRDVDSNNDGILDIDDAGNGSLDSDGDGHVDDSTDIDNDGIPDIIDEAVGLFGGSIDTDGDGVRNSVDRDDDNDSIPDVMENAHIPALSGEDSDQDGIDDAIDASITGGADVNGDGIDDEFDGDTDGDGVPDIIDLDSDNDGISDIIENGNPVVSDVNRDGVIDNFIDENRDGLDDRIDETVRPRNTDNIDKPDFQDLDADNDGISDLIEGGSSATLDSNNDGQIDSSVDIDGDGIADVVDPVVDGGNPGTAPPLPDTDGDGIRDYRDTDSDGDGFGDDVENGDFNNDGIPDNLQNDGKLETAVNGAGSSDSVMLLLLSLISLIAWFRKKNCSLNIPSHFWGTGLLAAIILLPQADSVNAKAKDCGVGDDSRQPFQSCWYIGAGISLSHLDPEDEANGWSTDDTRDSSFDVHIGQHFMPHWYWEGTYTEAGEAGLGNSNPALDAAIPNAAIEYKIPSLMLGYFLWEKRDDFNLYAKAGASFLRTKASSQLIGEDAQSSTQFAFGVGVQYRFSNSPWFSRFEFTSFDRDANVLSLRLSRFISDAKPRRVKIEEPIQEPEPTVAVFTPVVRDSDNDGVNDDLDECPGTPPSIPVDDLGCAVFSGVMEGVNFESNKAILTEEAKSILDSTVVTLQEYSNVRVEIQAHTDSKGAATYNLSLSKLRALAVINYLVDQGIDRGRLEHKGYGETAPIASNDTSEGRAANRRVELKVIKESSISGPTS